MPFLNGPLTFARDWKMTGDFVACAGSEAADHRHHQQEGRAAGDGDVGRLQHHHPRPQHLDWGAASRRLRGISPRVRSHEPAGVYWN